MLTLPIIKTYAVRSVPYINIILANNNDISHVFDINIELNIINIHLYC